MFLEGYINTFSEGIPWIHRDRLIDAVFLFCCFFSFVSPGPLGYITYKRPPFSPGWLARNDPVVLAKRQWNDAKRSGRQGQISGWLSGGGKMSGVVWWVSGGDLFF